MAEDYEGVAEPTMTGTSIGSFTQLKELEAKVKELEAKVEDLVTVARAANRCLTASRVFLGSEVPTEDMAHEAGEAEAELEKLLEAMSAKWLKRRNKSST
jgi:phage shock protein A